MIKKEHAQFIKENQEVLTEIFQDRVNELKDAMIVEENEEKRNRMRELALELKYWLVDIKVLKKDKKVKKENFI